MYAILDKLLLFLSCSTLYLFQVDGNYVIVPVITSVALSSLFLYLEDHRIHLVGSILYSVLCFFFPYLIIFLPLIMYDILHTKFQYGALLLPLLMIYHNITYSGMIISFCLILLILSYFLKYKTDCINDLRHDYNELRDNSMKMSMELEQKNQVLLQNQDYEINLAMLNERNRISKEIHDSIGHLLSRALLMVGALKTITKEEPIKEGLSDLNETLSGGMDQIRNSIHQMYDESIDLYQQVEKLIKDFTFCPVSHEYDITNPPPLGLKQSMISILKEALANIIRHSNATKVIIRLREHPVMYQLIIQDNGTIDESKKRILQNAFDKQEFGEGMGLQNIHDRVKSFGGNIHISLEDGYKLFLSFPKQKK